MSAVRRLRATILIATSVFAMDVARTAAHEIGTTRAAVRIENGQYRVTVTTVGFGPTCIVGASGSSGGGSIATSPGRTRKIAAPSVGMRGIDLDGVTIDRLDLREADADETRLERAGLKMTDLRKSQRRNRRLRSPRTRQTRRPTP